MSSVSPGTGRFDMALEAPCTARAEVDLWYNSTVAGEISYGRICALSWISAHELFWCSPSATSASTCPPRGHLLRRFSLPIQRGRLWSPPLLAKAANGISSLVQPAATSLFFRPQRVACCSLRQLLSLMCGCRYRCWHLSRSLRQVPATSTRRSPLTILATPSSTGHNPVCHSVHRCQICCFRST